MTDIADDTAPKQRVIGRPFQPGQSGNPSGRPKGARSELGESFLCAVRDDFNEHGIEAIAKAREESPIQYARMIAGLLPSEHTLNINRNEDLTDEQIRERIAALAAQLAPFLPDGTGTASTIDAGPARAKKSPRVH